MRSLRCRFGLAVLACLIAPLASASVHLPLPWKLGVQARYQLQSVQEDLRADKSRKTDSRSTERLDIVEAGPKGFLQVWTTESGTTEVSGSSEDVESMRRISAELAKRLDKLPVEVELDADGSFRRIRNWQVFGSAMREVMLPALLAQNADKAKAAKLDEASLRAKLDPLLDKLTSEAAVSASIGRPASIFNFFVAAKLSEGKPVEYEDYLPSPWSSDLIPTRGSFALEKLNASTATIHWRQGVDPAKGAEVMWKIVEAVSGVKVPAAERKGLPSELGLTDEAMAVIDRKTGLPVSIDYRREVSIGGLRKRTHLLLEKLP